MTDNLKQDLQDLHNRLVANYNDNVPFEQLEEDRLVVSNALDLINQYEEKVKKCENVERFADKTIATLQAEIERLKDYKQLYEDLKAEHLETIKLINKGIKTAQAEAIKEFAERLKNEMLDDGEIVGISWAKTIDLIDNLLKEMGVE